MRALLVALFGFIAVGHADSVLTVTISPSSQSGTGGQAVPYFGTLQNNTGDTVFINSDSFTFDIAGALDDSPFLNNAPISLDPDATSALFEFFAIDVPLNEPFGIYNGVFTVLGGADGNAQDVLGAASFSLTVPEPATGGAGLLACALVLWKARRRVGSRS